MNPAQVEFLAENQTIHITPNFSHDRLYLICGEVGPFRPGIPVQVPLWMAINLKQRQKCRITAPEWMTVETLTKIKEDEGQSKTFTPMPDEHYMVTTQLILGAAPHDIANADEVRILVKDIWDMRIAKLRSSVDAFLKIGGSLAKVDHLTLMEINTVRPFLPHALDQLFRLRQEKTLPIIRPNKFVQQAYNHREMALNIPDPSQIRRLINRVQKPLVFRGLIESWPMLKFSQNDWDNVFRQLVLECRVGSRNSRGDQPQWEGESDNIKCTYSEFIKWSENSDDVRNPEMSDLETDKHFLYYGYKYMKDIFDSEVLRMTEWKPFGYPEKNGAESTFWMGTAGAHTPCHYDTYGCNLVAQLSGRKRWILFPPEDTNFLKPTRVPYEESSVYSMINFEKWVGTIPDIEGTNPHVVDLLPGDVLFVPRHWWHHVRNEELSISINIWLELTNDDREARLHESLVKFLVAHTCRNLPPNVVSELLNPNEEDMAYADLNEIHNFVQYSFKALKDNEADGRHVPEDDALPDEPWILPVVCTGSSEPKVKKARPANAHSNIEVLDVVRAFCHPRVIETVSQLLKNEFKN